MAEMTIRLHSDPETGKKDIIVSLEKDAELLPHEHETLHRELLERLIEGGVLTAGEAGQFVVQREPEPASLPPIDQAADDDQRESEPA